MLFRTLRLSLSFKDPKVFQSMSTFDLMRSYSLFTAFSFNPLVRHAFRLQQLFPRLFKVLARPAFSQFCAGASEVEVGPRLAQLRERGVGAILDYAAESSPDLDRNVLIMQRAIAVVSDTDDRVAVKLTALVPVVDLERFASSLARNLESIDEIFSFPQYLDHSIKRIEQVIDYAYNNNVQVYVDAEWLAIQPALEALTLHLMRKYNKPGHQITVFNTYQCYLQRTLGIVRRDITIANKYNFMIGAKVVRGAYLTTERARAKALGCSDPVCDNYEETTNSYHAVLRLLRKEAVVDQVLVATHNPYSIAFAKELDDTEETVKTFRKFSYAQLLGMADNVTYTLAGAKMPVFKYVPYGPVEEVMPYLLRRAVENSALMGSVHVKNERTMVKAELRRRLLGY